MPSAGPALKLRDAESETSRRTCGRDFCFASFRKMHLNAAGVAYTLYLWTPDDLPHLALPLIWFAYKTRQEIPSHINPSMSARVVRLYLKVERSKTIRFGHRPECRAPSSGLRSLRSTHVNIQIVWYLSLKDANSFSPTR